MDAIGCGSCVMDVIINVKSRLNANEACDVTGMSWQYGGNAATGIVATAMLSGGSCAFMGTAAGEIGNLIRRDFERHSIDVSRLLEVEGESALVLAMAIESDRSRNFYRKRPPMAQLQPEQVDEAFIASAQYLLIADPNPYSLQAARLARRHNVKVVYDGGRYQKQGMQEIMREVDYLIPSEFFYKELFPEGDLEKNLRTMRTFAAKDATVIVTFGEKGLAGIDGKGFFSLPAYAVDAVDTTGAGDVFHGAFIAGLLHGMQTKDAARYASAASAIKCTRIGGRAGIPTHEVVLEFMRSGHIDYSLIDERVAYYERMPL